jgi:hypothetical protein
MRPSPDPGEQAEAAFRRLARSEDPPESSYQRLIGSLKARGLVRVRSPRRRLLGVTIGIAAAVVAALLLARSPERGPEFLLLLEESAGFDAPATREELRNRVREYSAWARRLAREEHLVSAGELEPLGARVQASGVQPLAGAQSPTGYFLIRAATLEDAQRLAQDSPHLKYGGQVIVRPVVQ